MAVEKDEAEAEGSFCSQAAKPSAPATTPMQHQRAMARTQQNPG
ncbi:MAG: hypothetical protein Q4D74_09960 [Comamonadaceae bacterium]|nr:hypothetical protein [Comamonadaceae bacterium]